MADSKRCEAPDCAVVFEPERATAKYHSATCRQRAARARKAAATNAADESKSDTPAEHGLVKAVRKELEDAKALESVPGQLALQFARRMANPDESGLSAMSKELRLLLAEAKGGVASATAGTPPTSDEDQDDEVKQARRRREEMEARAAAEAKA